MGFGILLTGYLFLLNLGVYEGFTNLIGFALMTYAMSMLHKYNKGLRYAFYAILPLLLLGVADFIFTGLEFLNIYLLPMAGNTAMAIAERLLTMLFTVLLLRGIEELADEVDISVLRFRAMRNRVFTYIYYVAAAALEVTVYSEAAISFAVAAVIPVTLFGLIVILLNVQVLHNSYKWICMPEDLEKLEIETKKDGHLPPPKPE